MRFTSEYNKNEPIVTFSGIGSNMMSLCFLQNTMYKLEAEYIRVHRSIYNRDGSAIVPRRHI